MSPLHRLPALAIVAASFALASSVSAEELRFVDGTREVVAERLGAVAGLGRTPIRLRYPDGREVLAEVDRTALVRFRGDGRARLGELGAAAIRELAPSIGLWLVEDRTGADGLALAARLTGAPGVADAVPNLYLRVRRMADPYTPTDPRFGGQWYFQNLGMPDAWGLTRGSADVTIVVVDTGCDLAHPDLAAKLDPGKDPIDGDDDPSFIAGEPGAAHGTECAGLIGAATENDEGIAGGCPECRLRCVRLITDAPVAISADVEAFQFALDVDADVVSNSWGFTQAMPVPQALADIIKEVATNGRGGKGALVLFAAGNDDSEIGADELQAADGVLCIGAVNNFDEATPFTNRGPALDVVAPTGTLTTDISGPGGDQPGDYTELFGGTSSACPVAAGVAGLLADAAPDKTSAELYDTLIRTTKAAPFAIPDANGHDPVYGYGIIQPLAALEDALGIAPQGSGGSASLPVDDSSDEGCSYSLPPQRGGSGRGLLLGLLLLLAGASQRALTARDGST